METTMKRFAATVLLLVITSGLRAEDLPKPLTEDERADVIKKWRESYDAAVAKTELKLQDAKLTKNRINIADLTAELSNFKKYPFLKELGGLKIIRKGEASQVGRL